MRWGIQILAGIALGASALVPSAYAALVNSYDFTTDLSDGVGAGADLAAHGGTISGGQYHFSSNQGLRLSDALANISEYGIEMRVTISDSLQSWNKLLDLRDLASDPGLYVFAGRPAFYPYDFPATGSVVLGQPFTVGIERANDTLRVFLDGAEYFSVADVSNHGVVVGNVLNFVTDDHSTSQAEAFEGALDFIRIHDDASTFSPVPLPGAAMLLAGGLLGLGWFRRAMRGA